jgi:hypothetical protein
MIAVANLPAGARVTNRSMGTERDTVDPVLSLVRQPHRAHELVVKLAQLGRDDPQAAPQTLAGLPEWQVRPRRKRVAA